MSKQRLSGEIANRRTWIFPFFKTKIIYIYIYILLLVFVNSFSIYFMISSLLLRENRDIYTYYALQFPQNILFQHIHSRVLFFEDREKVCKRYSWIF